MMVNGRHEEDAPTCTEAALCVTVPAGLNNNRTGFHHKNAACDYQDQRLMNQHRDNPEGAAERQRARVANKDLSGVEIEQKKTKPSSDHAREKDAQSARPCH